MSYELRAMSFILLCSTDQGDLTVEKDNQRPSEPQEPEKSHGLSNILRMIILVAGLAGAWLLLDWLINGK
jgi:hypothetical protein